MDKFISNLRQSQKNKQPTTSSVNNLLPAMNSKLKGLLTSKLKALLPHSLMGTDSTLKKSLNMSTLRRKGQKASQKKQKKAVDPFLYLNLKYLNTLKNSWVLKSFHKIISEDRDWPALVVKIFSSKSHIRNQKQHENIFNSGVLIFVFLKFFSAQLKRLLFSDSRDIKFQKVNGAPSVDAKCLDGLLSAPQAKPVLVQNLFLLNLLLNSLHRNLTHLKTNVEQFTKIYLVKDLQPFYRQYAQIFTLYQNYCKVKERAARLSGGKAGHQDEISRIIETTEKMALDQCKGFCCLKSRNQNKLEFLCPHQCKANFVNILRGYWKLFSLMALVHALKNVKEDLSLQMTLRRELKTRRDHWKIISFADFHRAAKPLFDHRLTQFLKVTRSRQLQAHPQRLTNISIVSKQEQSRESKPSMVLNRFTADQLITLNNKGTMGDTLGFSAINEEQPNLMKNEKAGQKLLFKKIFAYDHNLKYGELRTLEAVLFDQSDRRSGQGLLTKINQFYCLKLYSDLYLDFFRKLTKRNLGVLDNLMTQLKGEADISAKTLNMIERELSQEEGQYARFLENIRILRKEVDHETIEIQRLRELTVQKQRQTQSYSFQPKEESSTSFLMKILNWKKLEYYGTLHAVNRKNMAVLFRLERTRKLKIDNFNKIRAKICGQEEAETNMKIFDFSGFFEWLLLRLLRESEIRESSAKDKIDQFLRKHLQMTGTSLRSFAKDQVAHSRQDQILFFLQKKMKELQVFLIHDSVKKFDRFSHMARAKSQGIELHSTLERRLKQMKELKKMKLKRMVQKQTQI